MPQPTLDLELVAMYGVTSSDEYVVGQDERNGEGESWLWSRDVRGEVLESATVLEESGSGSSTPPQVFSNGGRFSPFRHLQTKGIQSTQSIN